MGDAQTDLDAVMSAVRDAAVEVAAQEDPLRAWQQASDLLAALKDQEAAIVQLRLALVLRVWMHAGQPSMTGLGRLLGVSHTRAHQLLTAARAVPGPAHAPDDPQRQ